MITFTVTGESIQEVREKAILELGILPSPTPLPQGLVVATPTPTIDLEVAEETKVEAAPKKAPKKAKPVEVEAPVVAVATATEVAEEEEEPETSIIQANYSVQDCQKRLTKYLQSNPGAVGVKKAMSVLGKFGIAKAAELKPADCGAFMASLEAL